MVDHIEHVTLTTGRCRKSRRRQISDDTIAYCWKLLSSFAEGGSVPMPVPGPRGYFVSGRIDENCLVAMVWAEGPPYEQIVTIGVADEPADCGAALWHALHQLARLPVTTSADQQPQAPWCGVLFEPNIAAHVAAAQWLEHFEHGLAWAWLERRSSPPSFG
jgi:hypothetical protein